MRLSDRMSAQDFKKWIIFNIIFDTHKKTLQVVKNIKKKKVLNNIKNDVNKNILSVDRSKDLDPW